MKIQFLLVYKFNLCYYSREQKGVIKVPTKISLKAARINANLTQKEAANRIGIDESTLVRWEKHPEIVQPKYHKKISEAYNFPVDYIFFG